MRYKNKNHFSYRSMNSKIAIRYNGSIIEMMNSQTAITKYELLPISF